MSELGRSKNELTLDNLRDRLRFNAENVHRSRSIERSIGAFAAATLVKLESDPRFISDIDQFIAVRKDDLTAAHALKLLERAYFSAAVEIGLNPDTDNWHENSAAIEADEAAYEDVHTHLLFSDVQTNIADRYKAIASIAKIFQHRFDGPPSYLDIGSSIGQGLKLMAYSRSPQAPDLAFEPMRLGRQLSSDEFYAAQKNRYIPSYDRRLTSIANRAIDGYFEFGEIRGVDKANVFDPRLKRWVRNNHYPGELVDGKTLPRFDRIASMDPNYQRIKMTTADITSKTAIDKLKSESDVKEYDIISCITMLYQIKDPATRLNMIVGLADLVKEGGIIILQDAKSGNFETPFEYKTSIIDTSRGGLRENVVLMWETARCRSAIVGPHKINVNGRELFYDEALATIAS